jgi:hypothetical protein
MNSLTERWHVVVIDLKFNRFYVLFEDRPLSDCEELIQDWDSQKMPDVVPVLWPATKLIPALLVAA